MAETLTSNATSNPVHGPLLDATATERLQQFSRSQGRVPAEVLSEALDQYLDRQEKRARFLEDARNSLEHYEATGLHLTGEEVDQWLAELETGKIVEPPECHL